jgi:Glucose / Sorbosone dehydrogenase
VPHVIGALRAGRGAPPQRADQLPPEQRKPVPGAYGAEMITKKGVFGIVQGHQNRHLAIDPKSGALFVGVGSSGNLGVEPEPKATIQRFDADGSNQMTYASGTRNPTALAFNPQTSDLWAVVQERDGLGDKLPSDYLIRVQQGGFYGWPYAYIGKHPQPGFANLAPDKVAASITPDLLFEPHSSLIDLVFYQGDQFPAEYKGQLFVALKGAHPYAVAVVVSLGRRDRSPVDAAFDQQSPDDAGRLVGQSHGDQHLRLASQHLRQPRTLGCPTPAGLANHGTRADDQQAPDRPFAAFGDGAELLLAAGRFLHRCQPEPGSEVAPGPKALHRRHQRGDCRRDNRPHARDRHQPACRRVRLRAPVDLGVQGGDLTVQGGEGVDEQLQNDAPALGQAGLRGLDGGDHVRYMADAGRRSRIQAGARARR